MRVETMRSVVFIWILVMVLAVFTDIYINASINQIVSEHQKEVSYESR